MNSSEKRKKTFGQKWWKDGSENKKIDNGQKKIPRTKDDEKVLKEKVDDLIFL